jgi:hypothetical protein
MADLDDLRKRVPLEEVDEMIAVVRRSLNTTNGSQGVIRTEPKLDGVLDIIAMLTLEVRRIRNHVGLSATADD